MTIIINKKNNELVLLGDRLQNGSSDRTVIGPIANLNGPYF